MAFSGQDHVLSVRGKHALLARLHGRFGNEFAHVAVTQQRAVGQHCGIAVVTGNVQDRTGNFNRYRAARRRLRKGQGAPAAAVAANTKAMRSADAS